MSERFNEKSLDKSHLRLLGSCDVAQLAVLHGLDGLQTPRPTRLSDELVADLTPPAGTKLQKMLGYLVFLHYRLPKYTVVEPNPISFMHEQIPLRYPVATTGDDFFMLSILSDVRSPYEQLVAERLAGEIADICGFAPNSLTEIDWVNIRHEAPTLEPRHLTAAR